MAKRKSILGTMLKLGGLAAAGAVIYYKRNEIKAFVADKVEQLFPEEPETVDPEEILDIEPDVVIDGTVKAETEEETEEDAPEA